MKLILKGALESIKPAIFLTLDDFKLFDKVNNVVFSNLKTSVNLNTDGKTFNGEVMAQNAKAILKAPDLTLNIPRLTLLIDANSININKSDILLEYPLFLPSAP